MIEVERVSKSYGTTAAVTDVSFVVPRGAVTGFVGPNGAGKSTVLRMIAGLTRADSGTVRVDGRSFSEASPAATTMGVFLSAESIPPAVTARGFLEYVCDTQGFARSRVAETLELVGLSHAASTKVRSFSLGMRQRLGIGAATIGKAGILVFDEPINGLDPDGIHWLRSFISHAASTGTTVLLSSHHMAELAMVADRVVMLDAGRVVAAGTIDDFVSTNEVESVYLESPETERARDALIAAGLTPELFRDGLLVRNAVSLDVGRIAFASGAGVSHLAQVSRSLEETYFDLLAAPRERTGV